MVRNMLRGFLRLVGAGALLALIATSNVHAQPAAQPKAFVLVQYEIHDRPQFLKLRDAMRQTLASYKGDLVSREKFDPIFGGGPAANLSIISFPTITDARAWLASKAMTTLLPEARKTATMSTYVVEKVN